MNRSQRINVTSALISTSAQSPSAVSLERTSARLTTLIAAPAPIAQNGRRATLRPKLQARCGKKSKKGKKGKRQAKR